MCEGLSKISGPIPAHPMFIDTTRYMNAIDSRQNSARDNSICEGPSKVSGPIQSDFSHDLLKQFESLSITNAKIRDSGVKYCNAGKGSSQMGLLLELQGRAITPRTFKLRSKPKNHMHDNRVKIKQLMHKVKEREAQNNVPVKALWKSPEYKEINSKLKELLEEPLAPRAANKDFLRAHSSTGLVSARRPQSARPSSVCDKKPDQPVKSKDDLDFIEINKKNATHLRIKRAPSVEMLHSFQQKRNKSLEMYENNVKGKVPVYLKKRNDQLEKEKYEQIRNQPDPEQPPNHRKLPEQERIQTLKLLQEKQQRLCLELNALPIRNDTYRMVTQKNNYEKQLGEIEEAIKIFSKPKVFVKIEN